MTPFFIASSILGELLPCQNTICTRENPKRKIKRHMEHSHHVEFCGAKWNSEKPCTRDQAMVHNLNLNFFAAGFVVSVFEYSAELALPEAGCSLSSAGRKCYIRRVDTETLAAGHLQWEIISWVSWDSVVCSSCKKPSSWGIFLWLLSPLQKCKNIWYLKIGYILNCCRCHLFSKKQLAEKNNLGLKPCMKLPFKISGVGFVIFIFLKVWGKGCLMATDRKQKCGTRMYALQTCRKVVLWRPVK